MRRCFLTLAGLLLLVSSSPSADAPERKKTPREALQAFNDLIGSWRGTGLPEGSRADKQKGAWSETIKWEWQFQKEEVWLKAVFEKGKYWTDGELRYVPEKDAYRLTLHNPEKESVTFEGALSERTLTLDRETDNKETQRITIRLLHDNRYLYQYDVKPQGKTIFNRLYQVGATKEGVPFATTNGGSGPECIVSGGPGTIKVMHKGQAYYVCCGGCKDAFLEDPEKYIKEAKEKEKAKEK